MTTAKRRSLLLFVLSVTLTLTLVVLRQDPVSQYIRLFVSRDDFVFPDGRPQCGTVCNVNKTGEPAKFYPFIKKSINCINIMKRTIASKPAEQWPPPHNLTSKMIHLFTLYGTMKFYNDPRVRDGSFSGRTNENVLKQEKLMKLQENMNENKSISIYGPKANSVIVGAIRQYATEVRGRRGVVVGTAGIPWMEAILVYFGSSHVTTIEYQELISDNDVLSGITPRQIAQAYLEGRAETFGVGATFSSLEHSGLGRYRDELNPYGNLEAMAMIWCLLKPGSLFFLGVPTAKVQGTIVWNLHRIYGPERLQHMTANFEVVDFINYGKDTITESVIVLRRV